MRSWSKRKKLLDWRKLNRSRLKSLPAKKKKSKRRLSNSPSNTRPPSSWQKRKNKRRWLRWNALWRSRRDSKLSNRRCKNYRNNKKSSNSKGNNRLPTNLWLHRCPHLPKLEHPQLSAKKCSPTQRKNRATTMARTRSDPLLESKAMCVHLKHVWPLLIMMEPMTWMVCVVQPL